MKIFNTFSIIVGFAGGFLSSMLGGLDKILIALVTLMILDYVTGICKAIVNKKLSSTVGFKGIIKKVMILVIVAVAVVIEGVVGDVMPIREIVIVFYLCNEAISLLENASEFVPIPAKLKEVLIQLREKNENSSK